MADIRERVQDPAHGSWEERDGKRVFTPKPSFFEEVDPGELVDFFNADSGDNEQLHLP